MTWDSAFETAFRPRVIAVVGVSNSPPRSSGPFDGLTSFYNIRDAGFQGRIYPINPQASEINGTKAYPTVSAVPEPVDLVIIAVPAAGVPQVMEDCIAAGALNIHVMSSGFGETGLEQGQKLAAQVREIISRGRLRLIGPNCMGLQVPEMGIGTFDIKSLPVGPVAFISQSGSHVSTLLRYGLSFGVGCSKLVSLGNAMGLDSTDFLEYLGRDPETGIIAMYLEGVRDGGTLLRLVSEINRVKPVIIWKGGLTESGAQAASSHTGSLKGDRQIWEAFFRQTGAVPARSIDELADILMTFLHLKPLSGNAAVLLGGGGGGSVAAGDTCGEEGVMTPLLGEETKSKLLQFVSLVNQGLANPLDIPFILREPDRLRRTLEIVSADHAFDFMIINQGWDILRDTEENRRWVNTICAFVRENPDAKPLIITLRGPTLVQELPAAVGPLAELLIDTGIPVYASLARGCRAILRFVNYHQRFGS